MKSECTKSKTLSFGVLLDEIRKQGTKDVSRPFFIAICSVIAVSLVGTIGILYSLGLDLIEESLGVREWLLGLLLLSLLLGWMAKYFLKLSLFLWRLTKEADE